MTITHARAAFNSIGADWIKVVTGSIAAIAILAISFVPLGLTHPWLPWTVFLFMWSLTWGWAFVRSWGREHAEVERLKSLLLREYEALVTQVRKAASSATIEWPSAEAEEDFYLAKIKGDADLIRQAVRNRRTSTASVDVNRDRGRF